MAADGIAAGAELEARVAELERELRVQRALVRIAEAAAAAEDLQAFYREVHETLEGLTYARNFYIALYDDQRGAINFPYYADAVDPDVPDPRAWEPFGVGDARGVATGAVATAVVPHDVSCGEVGRVRTQPDRHLSPRAPHIRHPCKLARVDGETIGWRPPPGARRRGARVPPNVRWR